MLKKMTGEESRVVYEAYYCLSYTFEVLTPCCLNSINLLLFLKCLHSKLKHDMRFVALSAFTCIFLSLPLIFQAFYPMDRTFDIKKGDILVRLNTGFI